MDQIVQRMLRFDRFALDLSRGCLWIDDQNVDLRPKAFEVLRLLAENAGQLVSKAEFYRAVWPDVVVGDDSLSQCIRELRQILSDREHRLIKTVPRRGYLLDAPLMKDPTVAYGNDLGPQLPETSRRASSVMYRILGTLRAQQRVALTVIAVIGCSAIAAIYFARLSAPTMASELFSQRDAERIAAIAADKEIPVPDFHIKAIERNVLPQFRRFVGVWASSTGFINSKRQFMLVITDVDRSGILTGFVVRGPRQALSLVDIPAGSSHFKARISGESFRYSGPSSEREVVLTAGNRLEFSEVFNSGVTVRVVLDPLWTLAEAER